MIRLALIGKSIQHSKSPEIYKRLFKTEVEYELLDYNQESLIPTAKELSLRFRGINITSPYKKYFINQVKLTPNAELVGAINCLSFKNNLIVGENTDFLAIIEILKKKIKNYGKLSVLVLGDGVMAQLTLIALKTLKVEFRQISRKTSDNFDQINLDEAFENLFNNLNQKLVINTCSRDFIFKGIIDNKTCFWDYNYDFAPHQNYLGNLCLNFEDGLELLELQAHFAIAFWSDSIGELNN